jgi:hypothetical protein
LAEEAGELQALARLTGNAAPRPALPIAIRGWLG